jgi:glycosyltransferase involved in cell wall biosynthesis
MGRRKLDIAIDARLRSGVRGGVEQFIIGLVSGLSGLERSETYHLICYEGQTDWIEPYVSDDFKVETVEMKDVDRRFYDALMQSSLNEVDPRPNLSDVDLIESDQLSGNEIPGIDEFDAIHFPKQDAFKTDRPNLYHPHDIQHLHIPEYYPPRTYAHRERFYRLFCENATRVPVASSWIKRDLVEQYGLPESKVSVVPLAPPLSEYRSVSDQVIEQTRQAFDLPESFLFFPAQTWPHKNHRRLCKALAEIRDGQLIEIPLVCAGRQNEYFPRIREAIDDYELEDQVSFLGFVSSERLQALYRLATGLVMPTEFEAASFPIWEAFLSETPVACSHVTSLPEQVGDAALLFDPTELPAIKSALLRLWTDEDCRQTLRERGKKRMKDFSWKNTAQTFLGLYRLITQRSVPDDLQTILDPEPTM